MHTVCTLYIVESLLKESNSHCMGPVPTYAKINNKKLLDIPCHCLRWSNPIHPQRGALFLCLQINVLVYSGRGVWARTCTVSRGVPGSSRTSLTLHVLTHDEVPGDALLLDLLSEPPYQWSHSLETQETDEIRNISNLKLQWHRLQCEQKYCQE